MTYALNCGLSVGVGLHCLLHCFCFSQKLCMFFMANNFFDSLPLRL